MKKSALILGILLVASVSAFAGAPAPTTEKPVPVQEVAPTPVAPVAPTPVPVKPLVISKHNTWGLGLGGNPFLGVVEKDQFGYPYSEYTGIGYGVNCVLGFGVTKFSGQPSVEDLNAAANKIKAANPNISDEDLGVKVREQLGNTLTYVNLGTALLIVPVNAEIGYQWVWGNNTRTRLGIGLPTLLCFSINWDY
jgi:hypothetical protein